MLFLLGMNDIVDERNSFNLNCNCFQYTPVMQWDGILTFFSKQNYIAGQKTTIKKILKLNKIQYIYSI